MPDLAMCTNYKRCNARTTCRRSEDVSRPSDYQAYMAFEPGPNGGPCENHWQWPSQSMLNWGVADA